MGRLVRACSEEEFKKFPKWQQWISINWWIIPTIIFGCLLVVPRAYFKFFQ